MGSFQKLKQDLPDPVELQVTLGNQFARISFEVGKEHWPYHTAFIKENKTKMDMTFITKKKSNQPLKKELFNPNHTRTIKVYTEDHIVPFAENSD